MIRTLDGTRLPHGGKERIAAVDEGAACQLARWWKPRILFASTEIFPLAKTGGLSDVSAALPAALASLGADPHLVMPGYDEALDRARNKRAGIPLGDILGLGEPHLIASRPPDTDLPLWLVDCPSLFRRRRGLYLDPEGRDWPDNAQRFAVLRHAVTRLALGAIDIGWRPDVVHLNDWQLGLVPALLAAQPGARPASVLTIHNLAFQGVFPSEIYPRLGLPSGWFTPVGVEYYGQVSFLKAGIRFADRLTTVSPRYAREILTPEFGCGLDGLLRARRRPRASLKPNAVTMRRASAVARPISSAAPLVTPFAP
jgi:starch synthase